MPDHRKHRGAHPEDAELFAPAVVPRLQEASDHLAWLLSRGYGEPASLELVGNRFALNERQRRAVLRATCSDRQREDRRARELPANALRDRALEVDGFNLLLTVEAALGGGVLLACRDGALRDMASMHGSYRRVEETLPAIHAIGVTLASYAPASVGWLLDRPVSNSGRLAAMLREAAEEHDYPWTVEVVPDPDPLLAESAAVVATADSGILDAGILDVGNLDAGLTWLNLAALVVRERVDDPWVVDLGGR